MIQLLMAKMIGQLAKNRLLLSSLFVAVGLIGIVGLFFFEGIDHNFKDVSDYLSWWLGSVTTTGFTAMPETFGGKIWDTFFKIPFFLTGFGFLGAWFAWIIETVTKTRRGLGTFSESGHILIIGWNPITAGLAGRHLQTMAGPAVVLLDPSLDGSPDERISFFVKGQPSLDATLKRAGVERALAAIISLTTDGATGLTASSVIRLNHDCDVTAIAIEVENIDRLSETGAKVLCATQKVAAMIAEHLGGQTAIAFGHGPIIKNLVTMDGVGIVPDDSDSAVDEELLAAQVTKYPVVIIEPRDDEHGWLSVASVLAQAPKAQIIVVLGHEENRFHLHQAGADLAICPTTAIVK